MSITLTPCLKKKLKSDKYGIINIRITQNRKSIYVSLKEKIPVRFWNDNTHQLRTHKDLDPAEKDRLTTLIENKTAELKNTYKASNEFDKTKSNDRVSFMDFLNDELKQLELRSKIGTYKRYKSTYYHLEGFNKSRNTNDLLFSQIKTTLVRDFETYLLAQKTPSGTAMKINTSKNYIKCFRRLYNQAVKLGVYNPYHSDPFVLFVNERQPVEQTKLEKINVEQIYQQPLEKSHLLFDTRNRFLFQIFSQGLRVSDLLTLRFENINRAEGRIDFIQFKTKKPNSIWLNDNILLILKDYVKPDLNHILLEKYPVEFIEGKIEKLNYYEIGKRYEEITMEDARKAIASTSKAGYKIAWEEPLKKAEMLKEVINNFFMRISYLLTKGIYEYAVKHPKDFIFPGLKNEDFKGVVFDTNNLLTKYQYNQLQSKETIYNKNLKKLQAMYGIQVRLTSHVSRHTYANLIFKRNPKRLYEISKSLGHRNIKMTENYLNAFDKEVVDETNIDFNNTFNHVKITPVINTTTTKVISRPK